MNHEIADKLIDKMQKFLAGSLIDRTIWLNISAESGDYTIFFYNDKPAEFRGPDDGKEKERCLLVAATFLDVKTAALAALHKKLVVESFFMKEAVDVLRKELENDENTSDEVRNKESIK